MSEQRGSQAPRACPCGHGSYLHDPWPDCEVPGCLCTGYGEELPVQTDGGLLCANEGGLLTVELRLDLTEWDRAMRGRPPEEDS